VQPLQPEQASRHDRTHVPRQPQSRRAYEPLPAIFPGHVAKVVRQCHYGERDLVLMSWGLLLLQDGRAPKRVTNVRDDTILKSTGAARSRSGAA
jgi:putative SOS response-associated peptidase YedK